ncbi:MAG: 6-carboxyhexanoate--CoA ligase [Nitrospirae bacterium]|nr:6-carboxyhexanoate--CoA ligase [Nitrospirota bacterium]
MAGTFTQDHDAATALYSIRMRASLNGLHISGAEGIYNETLILNNSQSLLQRALNHSRGTPDSITLTIERIDAMKIRKIPSLPIYTCTVNSEKDARTAIHSLLNHAGVGTKAAFSALNLIESDMPLSGAALVDALTGKRLDTEAHGGIRVSRLGIEDTALENFQETASYGVHNTYRVIEAVMLASKTASYPGVIAEVCISDNPEYTTGYVSSQGLGYVRIPHIKHEGDARGGRVYFIDSRVDVNSLTKYLQHTPVMIDKFGGNNGIKDLSELIGTDNS